MKSDVAVVVPAYNPGKSLLGVVQGLVEAGFERVVVVDDGSGDTLGFDGLGGDRVCLVRHDVNMGKGMALKSGFRKCLESFENLRGIITVDADGQHCIYDLSRVYDEFRCRENENTVVLGCRNFEEKNVPWRSKIGNNVTSKILEKKTGIRIQDTQTGLRTIPVRMC